MPEKKKKLILAVVAVIAAAALIFVVVWNATADARFIAGEIKDLQEEIQDCREEGGYFHFFFWEENLKNEKYVAAIVEQVEEICANGEADLLAKVLSALEEDDAKLTVVRDAVENAFQSMPSLEQALTTLEEMEGLEYYNKNLSLTRESPVVADYIQTNGTREFTTTPGTGYYANEEDSSSHNRVGIEGSALYDAESITHKGDFKTVHKSGVKLNSYYEEVSYSQENYYFRGEYLGFDPFQGECVWSGDYLFCFGAQSGELLGFAVCPEG